MPCLSGYQAQDFHHQEVEGGGGGRYGPLPLLDDPPLDALPPELAFPLEPFPLEPFPLEPFPLLDAFPLDPLLLLDALPLEPAPPLDAFPLEPLLLLLAFPLEPEVPPLDPLAELPVELPPEVLLAEDVPGTVPATTALDELRLCEMARASMIDANAIAEPRMASKSAYSAALTPRQSQKMSRQLRTFPHFFCLSATLKPWSSQVQHGLWLPNVPKRHDLVQGQETDIKARSDQVESSPAPDFRFLSAFSGSSGDFT
jgi:hypothetical protein